MATATASRSQPRSRQTSEPSDPSRESPGWLARAHTLFATTSPHALGDAAIARRLSQEFPREEITAKRIYHARRAWALAQGTTSKAGADDRPVIDLPLARLRTDGGTQMRSALAPETWEHYATLIAAGTELPPVDATHDPENDTYWLWDGLHRHAAHVSLQRETIRVRVTEGTQRDARLLATAANSTNGLQRDAATKRLAVDTLLDDPEWSRWSTAGIARHVGVSEELVKARRDLRAKDIHPRLPGIEGPGGDDAPTANGDSPAAGQPAPVVRKSLRNGKVVEIDTSNLGRRPGGSRVDPVADDSAPAHAPAHAPCPSTGFALGGPPPGVGAGRGSETAPSSPGAAGDLPGQGGGANASEAILDDPRALADQAEVGGPDPRPAAVPSWGLPDWKVRQLESDLATAREDAARHGAEIARFRREAIATLAHTDRTGEVLAFDATLAARLLGVDPEGLEAMRAGATATGPNG